MPSEKISGIPVKVRGAKTEASPITKMLAAKISLIVSIDMMGLRSEVSFQLLVDAGDMILVTIVDSSDEEKKVLPIDLLIWTTTIVAKFIYMISYEHTCPQNLNQTIFRFLVGTKSFSKETKYGNM